MDETNPKRYSRFAMPLGGAAARELIMDQLRPGLPLKRMEIARKIGDIHHSLGGRTMDRGKLIGVAKKELALMLKEGIVEQPAPGWYALSGAEPVQEGDYSDSYSEPIESPEKLRLPSVETMGQLNEAQTQRSVIEPILTNILRWDVTDHTRVHVEKALEAEISTNFVDYALDHDGDGKFEILIEAKHLNSPLMEKEAQQLLRYMDLSKAQLGILTNGATWLFFDRESDADSPILDFDIAELNADDELRRAFSFLSYDEWGLDRFISWAKSNGHLREIEGLVKREIFENPSDELIEFFLRKARPNGSLSKRALAKARDTFKRVVAEQVSSTSFKD